jgi:hypothetical protein
MFFLKQNDKYWDSQKWVEDWKQAIVYGSAAAAISQAPNRTCKATGANREQWEEYCLGCESLEDDEP